MKDASLDRAPADHAIGVGLGHRPVGEKAGAAQRRAEQQAFVVAGELRPVDISMQVSVEIVVAGHLVPLAAFLVQTYPGAPALDIHILDPHLERGADTSKGVDESAPLQKYEGADAFKETLEAMRAGSAP